MKQTKKLQKIFDRYNVGLRDENTIVTHQTYGRKTELNPLQFAVYETAIKSVYIANQTVHFDVKRLFWFQRICDDSDINLPYIEEVTDLDKAKAEAQQAASDYHYCVHLLSRAGLYYQLLD